MAYQKILAASIFLASSAITAPPIALQAPRIDGISVRGNQRVEAGTVQSYMLIAPGDQFDAARIDASLKTLFATGLFADVAINRDGNRLVVEVIENPIINQVIFEGNRALKLDKIKEEVKAKPRSVFTKARAQADVHRIIELYRRSGRFSASVVPKVRELPQNRVDLIFEIKEGPVNGVRSVNFIGNEVFSDRKLRSEIVTTQSKWWKILTSNDNYDPDRLEYDQELLRQFYGDQGYADFRIISAEAALTPDQDDFYVTFTIDEGEKYKFGEISVNTKLEKLNEDALESLLPIRESKQYQAKRIEDAIDSLTFAAGTAGYAFVDVRPRVKRNRDNRTVDIEFEVNEGPRVYVERINVKGNSRTLDRVIRREMRLAEGDAFNRVLLDRSKQRIRSLGYFEEVEIEERQGSRPDRSEVDITVKEQPTGELSFGAGFSSQDSYLFDVSVVERNLRGRGQYLQAKIAMSSRQSNIDIRFTEPKFLDRNLAAGFDLFSSEFDYEREAGYRTATIGGGLRVGFPITERTNLSFNYVIKNEDISIANANCGPNNPGATNPLERSSLCDQLGERLTSSLGYSFNWDRTNDFVRPTRGFKLGFSQQVAGLGGDVHYLRSEFSGSAHRRIWRDVIGNVRLSAGQIHGWGDDNININDRFFKGGNSFRGFDVAGIGPRRRTTIVRQNDGAKAEFVGDALGGQVYAISTIDINFPLGLPEEYGIRAALFAEGGFLGGLDDHAIDSNNFLVENNPSVRAIRRYAATDGSGRIIIPGDRINYHVYTKDTIDFRLALGASIFWKSPFGPIRFDFAEGVVAEDYDRQKSFRFSTSTRF